MTINFILLKKVFFVTFVIKGVIMPPQKSVIIIKPPTLVNWVHSKKLSSCLVKYYLKLSFLNTYFNDFVVLLITF